MAWKDLTKFTSFAVDWSLVYAVWETDPKTKTKLFIDLSGHDMSPQLLTGPDVAVAFNKVSGDKTRFEITGLFAFDKSKVCGIFLPEKRADEAEIVFALPNRRASVKVPFDIAELMYHSIR